MEAKSLTLKYIKDYLLLIDEEAEIKEGDTVYRDTGIIFKITNECISYYKEAIPKTVHKIYRCIAYYPLTKEAKELDLPLLPNPFEKEIDKTTLFKNLGDECFIKMKELNPSGGIKEFIRIAVEFGYKVAQSKQFGLEDIIAFGKKCFYKGFDKSKNDDANSFTAWREECSELIQSLSTQQLPISFEPEYDKINDFGEPYTYDDMDFGVEIEYKLKTITNSEGKEELVGTYKY